MTSPQQPSPASDPVRSRSVLRREAIMRGEEMPTFTNASTEKGDIGGVLGDAMPSPASQVADECPKCHARSEEEAGTRCQPEGDSCPACDLGLWPDGPTKEILAAPPSPQAADAELPSERPCAGCGLPELHKMCPAWGTPIYMDDKHPAWGNREAIAAHAELAAFKATAGEAGAEVKRDTLRRGLLAACERLSAAGYEGDGTVNDGIDWLCQRAELAEAQRDELQRQLETERAWGDRAERYLRGIYNGGFAKTSSSDVLTLAEELGALRQRAASQGQGEADK